MIFRREPAQRSGGGNSAPAERKIGQMGGESGGERRGGERPGLVGRTCQPGEQQKITGEKIGQERFKARAVGGEAMVDQQASGFKNR